MGTKKKQEQINWLLKKLGWSYRKFADVLYEEIYMSEDSADFFDTDSSEIKKLEEKLKKQLRRTTTPEERLTSYMEVLIQHPDYKALNLGMILPAYVSHDAIDEKTLNEMKDISNMLDDTD